MSTTLLIASKLYPICSIQLYTRVFSRIEPASLVDIGPAANHTEASRFVAANQSTTSSTHPEKTQKKGKEYPRVFLTDLFHDFFTLYGILSRKCFL